MKILEGDTEGTCSRCGKPAIQGSSGYWFHVRSRDAINCRNTNRTFLATVEKYYAVEEGAV